MGTGYVNVCGLSNDVATPLLFLLVCSSGFKELKDNDRATISKLENADASDVSVGVDADADADADVCEDWGHDIGEVGNGVDMNTISDEGGHFGAEDESEINVGADV